MYAQATTKPNALFRYGAYGIVMKGVQISNCAGVSDQFQRVEKQAIGKRFFKYLEKRLVIIRI